MLVHCEMHRSYNDKCEDCKETMVCELLNIFEQAVLQSGKTVKHEPTADICEDWLDRYGPEEAAEAIKKGTRAFLKTHDVITKTDAFYLNNYLGTTMETVSNSSRNRTASKVKAVVDDADKSNKYRIIARHTRNSALGTVTLILTATDAKHALAQFKIIVHRPQDWNIDSNEEV
jgi:hypothetical protein